MDAAGIVVLLGIIVAISWGISDLFAAQSAKSIGAVLAAVLVNIAGTLMYIVIYALFLRFHSRLTWTGFAYAAMAGIFVSAGAAAFFVGLEAGPVSIVSPLTSMYPLVTTFLALAIFHVHLAAREIVGILLVTFGITVASGLVTLRKPERKLTRGTGFALLTALAWGAGFALLAQAIRRADWQVVLVVEFSFIAVSLVAFIPFIKGDEIISISTVKLGFMNKFVLGASLIQLLGVVTFSVGISKSTVSGGAVVTAISACYPILTIFLALKRFDEKVRAIPLFGAFVGIFGVVVLSLR